MGYQSYGCRSHLHSHTQTLWALRQAGMECVCPGSVNLCVPVSVSGLYMCWSNWPSDHVNILSNLIKSKYYCNSMVQISQTWPLSSKTVICIFEHFKKLKEASHCTVLYKVWHRVPAPIISNRCHGEPLPNLHHLLYLGEPGVPAHRCHPRDRSRLVWQRCHQRNLGGDVAEWRTGYIRSEGDYYRSLW